MSILHIHAGLPKTGTTALQKFLMLNRERLRERGILIPETGYEQPRGNHHAFAQGIGSFNPLDRRRSVNAMVSELHSAAPSKALVSSEFAYLMSRYGKGLAGFRSLARQSFQLRFHLFVRPQPDFAVSAYPEVLRNLLLPQSFDSFTERVFPKLGGDLNGAVELFEAISPGNVRILPYARANRARGVWWDLLESMGHTIPEAEQKQFTLPGEVNLSLDAVGVAALLASLEQIEAAGSVRRWSRRLRLREVLLRATEEIKGGDFAYNPLSPANRRRMWSAAQVGNDQLARKYWGESWDSVFAEEKAASPDLSMFERSACSPENQARFDAHRAVLMDALLTKISRMKARARLLPFGIFTYPVDYAGDRLLRALVQGR